MQTFDMFPRTFVYLTFHRGK